jgi:hypothetical protein
MNYYILNFYTPKDEMVKEVFIDKDTITQSFINRILLDIAENFFGHKYDNSAAMVNYLEHCYYTKEKVNQNRKKEYWNIIVADYQGNTETESYLATEDFNVDKAIDRLKHYLAFIHKPSDMSEQEYVDKYCYLVSAEKIEK